MPPPARERRRWRLSERTFSVLDGSTFVVSDRLGDMRDDEGRDHGFFCQDTRFLSRWVQLASEKPLELLGLDQQEPYLPELASTTLRVLAAAQADDRDDFHERKPGKILHELRFGELTAKGERPHSPYFGSADATPLCLILLDEYHRWSGDDELVRALEPDARAALAWIEDSGDAGGDGYVEYSRRDSVTGLINQCWKDSWDAIQFADGTLPRGPIATCEIQGYVYDARCRAARLAREVWGDRAFAERLELQARDLQASFHGDFWMPERGCHAVALDGEKRQVDSLTSNIGHLLWSGLLDDREAATTADRLLESELYSDWCVRTLGAGEAGYNPLGYHTGNRVATRELADRRRPRALRPPRASSHDRRRNALRGAALRAPPARGLRRLSGCGHIRPRRLLNRFPPPGMGSGHPTTTAHHLA